MTRIFIALESNQDQQTHLTNIIRQIAPLFPNLRFVALSTLHLTLAFLGELDDHHLTQALFASQQTAQSSSPFIYRLHHLGTFGPPHSPHILWISIEEPTGALHHLHQTLKQHLHHHNFQTDKRPFTPHLTLARTKHPLTPPEQQRLQHLLTHDQSNLIPLNSYPAHTLAVMKSDLLPSGPLYTPLQQFPLTQPS